MRRLNQKQKNIIIDYIKNDFFNNDYLIEQFNNEVIIIQQLEKINDYETLITDFKRLKNDLFFIDSKEDKIKYVKNFI